MKKDFIFTIILLLAAILLGLLKTTGIAAHIAISIVGALVLAAYTAATKKEWKIPALEILMRACYGIALITGIVIMKVSGVAALPIVHRIASILFIILVVVLFVHKKSAAKK